jgi:hypothetical protein
MVGSRWAYALAACLSPMPLTGANLSQPSIHCERHPRHMAAFGGEQQVRRDCPGGDEQQQRTNGL